MDPLSSLSVASSAIQIFDFSSKLWKQIRELYQPESGAKRAQETALIDSGRLCNLNSGLSKLLTPENLQRKPTTREENIVSMCNECGDAAGQLTEESTDYASTAKKRKATQPLASRHSKRLISIEKRLDAVWAAIKGVWMKKDVDKLCERIETLKHSLASAILVNIRWFYRLWIRQEILALEEKAVVQCGPCDVAWPLFRRGLMALYKSNRRRPPSEYEGRLYEWLLLLRGFIGQPSTVGLGFIRVVFGQSSSSDRRDRLYAVLNFLPPAERELIGIPDYTKDFGTVFRDVLWRWIVRFDCCNLISQCEPGPDDAPSMPSWRPDWSKKETIFGRVFWRGAASSQLAAVYSVTSDRRVLSLSGVSTMTIECLQTVPDILTARHVRGFADAIRHLIPENELSGQYVTGISMKEAYARTILSNALEEHSEPWVGYEPSLEDGIRTLEHLYRLEGERDPEDKSLGPLTGFFGVSRAMLGGRQLMHATGGYLGIAPPLAREGDIVCVLLGCHTPMVLRPRADNQFGIGI
ncbi:hypothetical protein LA080_000870 [Diaporthe eres]|nr:hypothetical protein LA080_000870 [Diaporthe eres]